MTLGARTICGNSHGEVNRERAPRSEYDWAGHGGFIALAKTLAILGFLLRHRVVAR